MRDREKVASLLFVFVILASFASQISSLGCTEVYMASNNPASIYPLVKINLERANELYGYIQENLPEEVPASIQLKLNDVQTHMSRVGLTNLIYCNGELAISIGLMEEIEQLINDL